MNGSSAEHHICIYNRKTADLSGITEVENFCETEINLRSPNGDITVEGENLKIESFSVESGKLCIAGDISGVFYYEKFRSAKGGLFARRAK